MKHLQRLVIGACTILSLTGSPASAADQWHRVRSDHFTVIGNTNGDALRAVAQTLERFRDVLTQALPNAAMSTGETVVVLFKNDASFQPYKPAMVRRDSIGGVFRGSDDVTFLALNAENLAWAMQSTLGGYSQFMVGNTLGSVPPWVSLGIAEMYRTFQERSGGKVALLGVPDDRQVAILRGATLIPLPELLRSTLSEPGLALGEHKREIFIAESWALVHYLTLSSKERTPQFQNYLRLLRSGDRTAAVAALGDLGSLESELNQYVRHFLFPALQLNFETAPPKEARREVETLKAAEAAAYLSGLQAMVGDMTTARATLEKAVTNIPDEPLASLVLGVIELRANNTARALPLLEHAASQKPEDGFFQSTYGRALAGSIYQPGKPPLLENVEPARRVLSKAVELDAQSPVTLAALGRAYLAPPSDSEQAATFLRRAVVLSPAREDYQLSLATALLQAKDFAAATTILGPLMARGSTAGVRDSARRQLATINDRQAGITPAAQSGSPNQAPGRVAMGTAAPGVALPGNGVVTPRLIREVKPSYTSEARRAKIEGTVLLQCVVKKDGSVGDVVVLRSLDKEYGLDKEAIKAASQWQFSPGTRNGEAVAVQVVIELKFTIR